MGGKRGRSVALIAVTLALVVSCGATEGFGNLEGVVVSKDGRRLVVLGVHGACDKVLPARVQETPQQVTVSVPLQVKRGSCQAIGLLLKAGLQLATPLGKRRVVDGRTGDVLPRRISASSF